MAKKKKSAMPEGGITEKVGANIGVELMNDFENFSNGHMLMTITEVKIGKEGKELGVIRFDMNGMAVQAIIGKRSWMISVRELWPIFLEADERYRKDAK